MVVGRGKSKRLDAVDKEGGGECGGGKAWGGGKGGIVEVVVVVFVTVPCGMYQGAGELGKQFGGRAC